CLSLPSLHLTSSLPLPTFSTFSLYYSLAPRDLHSFPTRRSSDLALASLPKEQRAAVLYRDVLGLSYGETAEQMGRSVNAVTMLLDRKSTRLNSSHLGISYAVFCLKKKKKMVSISVTRKYK